MKVVFIYMGAVNLGIESLSAVLEDNGHQTELIYDPALFDDKRYLHSPFLSHLFNQEKKVINDAVLTAPDLVAISTITDNYKWACRIAEGIKNQSPDIPIVFGGPHVTLLPEKVIQNDFVDFAVRGEGEFALLELANALQYNRDLKEIGNLYYKKNGKIISNPMRPLIEDLDIIPNPNKELFDKYIPNKDEYIIITGRGCPFVCTFCCNHVWKNIYSGNGTYLRKRSVKNVISELEKAKKKYGFNSIYFADEVFTWDKEWTKEFAEIYPIKIGIPFKCVCHPMQMDEDTIKLLKKSGCYAIQIGIQSTDEKIKKTLLKRPESNKLVKDAVVRCHKNKITIIVDHIFGLPGETEDSLIDAAEFYVDIQPKRITNYSLTYFPKTEIVGIAKEMGILNDERIERIESGDEASYISGGSITDKNHKRTVKNFSVFFTLIPFISKRTSQKILKNKTYNKLYLIPPILLSLFDLLTVIFITHESRATNYLKYYYRELKNFFVGRR